MPRGAFVSPLPMGPEIPRGFVASRGAETGVYQQYLPIVRADAIYPCFMSPQAAALAELFENEAEQKRIAPYCDIRLVKAAEHRAQDMAVNAYFNHMDKEGHEANYWIEQYGCELPDYYPDDGNSTESIALNQPNAEEVWATWRRSQRHWVHVAGTDSFYASQRAYGVGYADGWGKMWVILTAPPCK